MPPSRKVGSYLMPFLIIIVILAIIVLVWYGLNRLFIDSGRSTQSEKVFLNIESGSAKAMTVGKGEWQNAPDKIYLVRGEALKTASDGRATLTFFEQSILRLNTNTEVAFSTLKKKEDSFNIQVNIAQGDVWAKVESFRNPDSRFSLTTDLLTIDTRGGVMAITAPNMVYQLSGSSQIGVKVNDEVIKTYTLGVGQQFSLDEAKIDSIKNGEDAEVIFALSDPFKQTNWYLWNAKKDGMIEAYEAGDGTAMPETTTTGTTSGSTTGSSTSLANIDRVAYVTKPTQGFATNKSSISVEGNFDTEKVKAVYVNGVKASMTTEGKWKMDSVKLLLEGENKIKLEAEDLSGVKTALDSLVVTYDKTPPAVPVITDPKATGTEPVTIESVEQMISGTVSADTQAVIVNDYRLGKYVPGSKTFQYWAKVAYGNLIAGDNEFKVYAEDKAGNQSEPATIIFKLEQETIDKSGTEVPATSTSGTTSTSSVPSATSTGGVKITAPNNGVSFKTTETEFEIAGTVPEGTSKVTVNDYTLSLFTSGSTTFKYRAFKSIGNLEIGKMNTYTVKAYDDADKLLGQASITIDVESGASADPVITIPTEASTYSTTLDALVVGGTVGKWVTRVYLNDKEIVDYIPGSEKWKMSVKLDPGKNTYTVTAERSGVSTGGSDTIEITLQQ